MRPGEAAAWRNERPGGGASTPAVGPHRTQPDRPSVAADASRCMSAQRHKPSGRLPHPHVSACADRDSGSTRGQRLRNSFRHQISQRRARQPIRPPRCHTRRASAQRAAQALGVALQACTSRGRRVSFLPSFLPSSLPSLASGFTRASHLGSETKASSAGAIARIHLASLESVPAVPSLDHDPNSERSSAHRGQRVIPSKRKGATCCTGAAPSTTTAAVQACAKRMLPPKERGVRAWVLHDLVLGTGRGHDAAPEGEGEHGPQALVHLGEAAKTTASERPTHGSLPLAATCLNNDLYAHEASPLVERSGSQSQVHPLHT